MSVKRDDESLIRVQVTKHLKTKKWKVLRFISRVQDFPKFMPNVRECRVLERGDRYAITTWNVQIDGIPLSWMEKDEFDLANFRIRFQSIKGDLERFEGEWVLKDSPEGGTEVTVSVALKIGIPLVENIIGGVLMEKVKKNFEMMLKSMDDVLQMRRYKNIGHRKVSDIKGFAVIGHPYNLQHLVKYFKFFKPDFTPPSQEFLVKLFELTPSYKSYDIVNFKSKTGKTSNGYFIMCPIIPDMLVLSPENVVEKVIAACKVAEGLGVGIVTLGGFASIAGEQYGKAVSSFVNVPVTTGNTLTVALVLDGIHKAAAVMELDLKKARVTVIGGTGDIGGSTARILSGEVAEVTITGRNEKNLIEAERVLSYYSKAEIRTSRDNNEAVRGADIVLAAASASSTIVDFKNFKAGAIICDVGYPKNISYTACDRSDILIFSGGIASIPSEFNLGFSIGLPSTQVLYGCFAEAILLDLEERYENFSWGKGNVTQEKVDYIWTVAAKHGFKLAPFFWGNQIVSEDQIRAIRKN